MFWMHMFGYDIDSFIHLKPCEVKDSLFLAKATPFLGVDFSNTSAYFEVKLSENTLHYPLNSSKK